MSQDREHVINQMTNGAVTKIVKNEAQGGPLKRYAHATNVMENPKLTLPQTLLLPIIYVYEELAW